MTEPTALDIANAETRAEIAARFQRQWDECAAHAAQLFAPDFEPSCRHYLTDKQEESECRRTGARPSHAATVYTVRHRESGEKRHFVLRDGQPVAVESMEVGFGPMLDERHPTMRIEVGGESVAPHRYSLCWSGYESYRPKTAVQLAAAREKREEKKVEREAERMPLFAEQIRKEGQPNGASIASQR
ncbi:MAG TPA: hypothetical protein VFE62_01360 [Gemmataceae bacterium]|nr:hypothetical protein [Gemmataceae bacterium]